MRSILYARVSLEEQAEQFGLSSQLRASREFAQGKGYTSMEELADEGYSGADLDRPALSKIRALVRAGQVDVVIAHDPDRLSRKRAHQFILAEEFERAGVRLEFVTTPAADTPEAKMLLDLKGMFADYEREKIRERTLRGRREKAKQGFIVGGRTLFGYRYLGKAVGERGKLVIDPDRAAIVRQVFTWAADGESVRAIAKRLNEADVSPSRAERWGRSSVARLLKNETYIGTAHYNRRKRSEPRGDVDAAHRDRRNKRTLLKERPKAEWIAVSTPAIVDRALFDRVAIRLSRNQAEISGRISRRYLLRGLLWCGHCGLRMAGDPNHGTPCYRCAGRDALRKTFTRCQQRVNAQKLDAAVWTTVKAPFEDEARLRAVISASRAAFQKPAGKANLAAMRKKIESLKVRESRGVRALLDVGSEHQEMLRAEIRRVADERRRLESELAGLQAGAVELRTGDFIGSICREIADCFAECGIAEQQEFVRRIVERITLKDKAVTIQCAIPAPVSAGNCPQRVDDWPAWLGQDDAREAAGGHSAAAHI
jgi:site-specific DNA recombinase